MANNTLPSPAIIEGINRAWRRERKARVSGCGGGGAERIEARQKEYGEEKTNSDARTQTYMNIEFFRVERADLTLSCFV